MESKIKKLLELRDKIIDKNCKEQWKDVWFYPKDPRDNGVKGYLGVGDIIFIGSNPSYNEFHSRYTKFFYDLLKDIKLKNSHLTDLVKIREFNKNSRKLLKDNNIVKEQLIFLKEEFKIIKPRLIVILGRETGWGGMLIRKILEKEFPKLKKNIINIYHYSYGGRFAKSKEKFINDMKKIKQKEINL